MVRLFPRVLVCLLVIIGTGKTVSAAASARSDFEVDVVFTGRSSNDIVVSLFDSDEFILFDESAGDGITSSTSFTSINALDTADVQDGEGATVSSSLSSDAAALNSYADIGFTGYTLFDIVNSSNETQTISFDLTYSLVAETSVDDLLIEQASSSAYILVDVYNLEDEFNSLFLIDETVSSYDNDPVDEIVSGIISHTIELPAQSVFAMDMGGETLFTFAEVVPEPAGIALLGLGCGLLRRRKKA